jgi:UDP-glucose 4-epimerase
MRVFGSGNHTRDYVYVTDVVQAFLKALDGEALGTFNIGSGKETSVLDIISSLSKVVGSELSIDSKQEVVGEMARSSLNADKANTALSWQPKVSLQEGIQKTYEWFKALA